jgi:hypothetical protein
MPRLLIHTATFISGVPVSAGEVVDVDEDTARSLAQKAGPAPEPEAVECGDPTAEHRDPEPAKKSKR